MFEEADSILTELGSKPKKFTVKKEFNLDYTKLESDLRSAIESDQRYWLQNDAKLRAVQQPGTYEDFRQIVLGAHLKPMEKVDKITLDPNNPNSNRVIWNTAAATDGKPDEFFNLPGNTRKSEEIENDQAPKTMREFLSTWKSMNTVDQKFNYFIKLIAISNPNGHEPLKPIFMNDLPLNELPDIIRVLLATTDKYEITNEPANAPAQCLTILHIISESKRFDFSKVFFTAEDLVNVNKIISNIENWLEKCTDCEDQQVFLGKLKDVKCGYAN